VRALEPRVIDAVFTAIEGLLPARGVDDHPLGCHRPRIGDRECFTGMLLRLVTGCSWRVAARFVAASATTLRRRRDEWVVAGVFEALADEAIAAYDRICGLDLSEVAVDGSLHKAPCGGQGTGRNPTDRGKRGWKWSLATERAGVPIGWAVDGANRHDIPLLAPTLAAVETRGLLADVETLHLDRGYDANTVRTTLADHGITDAIIFKQRRRGDPKPAGRLAPLGLRWSVERTNSWLANYGQLRRNTDRFTCHRLAQLALAIVLIITIKLIDVADRYHR
jgi:transposase